MNNDLISREALKEEIVKLCERINANNGITVPTLAFTRIIDNAPTVGPRVEYGTDGQPYRLFMSSGQVVPDTLQGWKYETKPKGEWITGERNGEV